MEIFKKLYNRPQQGGKKEGQKAAKSLQMRAQLHQLKWLVIPHALETNSATLTIRIWLGRTDSIWQRKTTFGVTWNKMLLFQGILYIRQCEYKKAGPQSSGYISKELG